MLSPLVKSLVCVAFASTLYANDGLRPLNGNERGLRPPSDASSSSTGDIPMLTVECKAFAPQNSDEWSISKILNNPKVESRPRDGLFEDLEMQLLSWEVTKNENNDPRLIPTIIGFARAHRANPDNHLSDGSTRPLVISMYDKTPFRVLVTVPRSFRS